MIKGTTITMATTAKGEKRTRTVSLETVLKRLTPAQRTRVEVRAHELRTEVLSRSRQHEQRMPLDEVKR